MTITKTAGDQAVLDVLDDMYAAWAAADADGIASLYTDDATVVLPGVYQSGARAVRESFAAGFEGRLKGSTTVDESREVRLYGADTAVVTSVSGVIMSGRTAERASLAPDYPLGVVRRYSVPNHTQSRAGRGWTARFAAFPSAVRG